MCTESREVAVADRLLAQCSTTAFYLHEDGHVNQRSMACLPTADTHFSP